MKINKLHMVNFGKFTDFSLDFSQDFQIIYGNNEDGKSTIMAFLLLMLYGNQGRIQRIEEQPRKKYLPWNGSPMEGALDFEHDGTSYHVTKVFGDTFSKDKVTLLNKNTGETVSLGRNEELGEYFFGLDLAAFKRSSYISQLGAMDAGGSGDMVAEKLIQNLVQTGDESVSQPDIHKRLSTALTELVSKNGKKGMLAEAKDQLIQLEEEKQVTQSQLEHQQEFVEEYQQLEQGLQEQQQLEKLISGYQANQSKQQLSSLLQLQQQVGELKERLASPNYSYEDTERFLANAKSLLQDYKDTEKTVQSLEESLSGFQGATVTTEEFDQASTLQHQVNASEKISAQWENRIAPQWEVIHQHTEKIKQLEAQKNALEEKLEQAKPEQAQYQELARSIEQKKEEYSALGAQLQNKGTLWKEQRALKEERLFHAQERSKEENKSRSKVFPLLFLLLGVGGGLLTYFLQLLTLPFSLALMGAGVLLCVLFLFVGKAPKQSENAEQFQSLKGDFEAWKEEIAQEESNLREQKQQVGETLTQEEQAFTQLSQKLPAWEHLAQEEKNLSDSLQKERLVLENQVQSVLQLQEGLAEDYLSPAFQEVFQKLPQSPQDPIEDITTDLLTLQTGYSSQLLHLFSSKEVQNMEEFQALYLEYQSQMNTRQTLEQNREKQLSLEKEFLKLLRSHTLNLTGFAQAVDHFNRLSLTFNMCQSKEQAIENKAEALGYQDVSISTLEHTLAQLSQQATSYEVQDLEQLKVRLRALEEQNLLERMKQLQTQMRPPARNLEQIHKEIRELSEEVEEMQHYYDSLALALSVMEEADEELHQSFGPLLNQTTSKIFAELTNHRYDEVLVSKDYDIKVKTGVHFREWQYLSNGTIDQVYLSLRLAISQLISPENAPLPLFLDDVLIQYDDTRAQQALAFLKNYSTEQNTQILLFSCHRRMVEFGEQLEIASHSL